MKITKDTISMDELPDNCTCILSNGEKVSCRRATLWGYLTRGYYRDANDAIEWAYML